MNLRLLFWLLISLSPVFTGFCLMFIGIVPSTLGTLAGYVAASAIVVAYGLYGFIRADLDREEAQPCG